ncbi:hypothetical protein E3N88_33159 [Mikania micrantha]|uniref:DUF4220 domain-containing protein n=1 Tax=Mikania micrantha TaxID=192012 RepID=A0A5N6MAH9_9ASTR|nr:hypothetical protein E3N88_33159 [Mikania micrantha]
MGDQSSAEVMLPWVGLYAVLASLICIIVMGADAILAIWQWKLWFPNKFFTLNAATITLIAVAMKLPVDLSTNLVRTKFLSILFLVTMLANFLPSLGLMNDRELLMNIVALAILMITIVVNMVIQMLFQLSFGSTLMIPFIFSLLWPFSVALTVSATRKKLELRYKESQQFVSSHQEKMFSSKELKLYVKKYWMMAETHNPQFVIACSSVSSAFGSFAKRFIKAGNTSNSNMNSEIEEYSKYVVQIEEEAKLSKRILRNMLRSITQLLDAQKEPCNLMKLLEKSKGFRGVFEFDNHGMIQHLYPDQSHNCWSLVVITLATIAIALPNIANVHFTGLLVGIKEGLQIVRHIEHCLNADGELVNAIKSASRVWKEVEVHRTWLLVDLQKKACKGKKSKDIFKWLGDEAEKIMKKFSNKKRSIDQSPYKFILANSMYRISKTILMHINEHEIQLNDEEIYERISTIIADVLLACFTNLPRVIRMKCQHNTIEKRGDNIRIAAQLLGKSKRILKILKARPLPNIDQDSMAYIDKWRAVCDSQILDYDVSSSETQPSSSSGNESLITINLQ